MSKFRFLSFQPLLSLFLKLLYRRSFNWLENILTVLAIQVNQLLGFCGVNNGQILKIPYDSTFYIASSESHKGILWQTLLPPFYWYCVGSRDYPRMKAGSTRVQSSGCWPPSGISFPTIWLSRVGVRNLAQTHPPFRHPGMINHRISEWDHLTLSIKMKIHF